MANTEIFYSVKMIISIHVYTESILWLP